MPPKLNTKTKALDGSAPSTPTETNAPDAGKSCEAVSECVSARRQKGKTKNVKEKAICKGNSEKVCNKPVENDENGGIECEICLAWFHPSCQNLQDEAYKATQQNGLFWICMGCKALVPKFREIANDMSPKPADLACLSRIEEKIDLIRKEIGDHNNLVKDTVTDVESVKKLYSDVLKNKNGDDKVEDPRKSLESMQECLENIQREKTEQEKRRRNLAVSNLPESEAASGEDRKKDDVELLSSIIKEELKLIVKIEHAFRVGKKTDERARILIVTLETEDCKWEILKAAKKLRESENEMAKNVFINKDLTRLEREKNKKLREEVKARRERGENVKIIRGRCTVIADQRYEETSVKQFATQGTDKRSKAQERTKTGIFESEPPNQQ